MSSKPERVSAIGQNEDSSSSCLPYANHEQLSMRDRENGEADSHGSEKKGRRETMNKHEQMEVSNRRKLLQEGPAARRKLLRTEVTQCTFKPLGGRISSLSVLV